MKLSVILPAYNEERTIAAIIQAVLGVDFDSLSEPVELELVVVDDASKDRTAECVPRDRRVKLIRHDRNQGKGAAIRTALAHVTGDVVLIQDADMEYFVQDYPALLKPFFEGAEVVYGSRFLKRRFPRNMAMPNWLAISLLTILANILYRAHLTDEATCFKVFRAPLLKSLPLKACGFDFCPETTALVCLRKIPIREVPIDYVARTQAEGKKIRWTHGFEAIKTLLAYRFFRR